jgi:ElaB/YqjD/DUF883 family membrane-anchored ribosome-binding protein
MSKHTHPTVSDAAGQLVDDAQALLAATSDIAEEKVIAARKRLSEAVKSGRETLEDLKDRAIARAKAGAKATDEAIRENPYQAVGIALGVGVLLGYFLGRRK